MREIVCSLEKEGFIETAKKIIEKGISNCDYDQSGKHALHYAVIKGEIKIVEAFINCHMDLNVRDFDERTPLHYAYMNDNNDIAEFLISNGANKYIIDYISFYLVYIDSNYGKYPSDYK